MASLQVQEINNSLYEWLCYFAKSNNRSVGQEVISILQEKADSVRNHNQNKVDEFLSLSEGWEDNKNTEEIISDIMSSRNNSPRFGEKNVLFD